MRISISGNTKIKAEMNVEVQVYSPNGNSFRKNNVSATLYAYVFQNGVDITNLISEAKFNWKRVSSGTTEQDESWNTSAIAIGHKTLTVGNDDVIGRTTFSVEVDV